MPRQYFNNADGVGFSCLLCGLRFGPGPKWEEVTCGTCLDDCGRRIEQRLDCVKGQFENECALVWLAFGLNCYCNPRVQAAMRKLWPARYGLAPTNGTGERVYFTPSPHYPTGDMRRYELAVRLSTTDQIAKFAPSYRVLKDSQGKPHAVVRTALWVRRPQMNTGQIYAQYSNRAKELVTATPKLTKQAAEATRRRKPQKMPLPLSDGGASEPDGASVQAAHCGTEASADSQADLRTLLTKVSSDVSDEFANQPWTRTEVWLAGGYEGRGVPPPGGNWDASTNTRVPRCAGPSTGAQSGPSNSQSGASSSCHAPLHAQAEASHTDYTTCAACGEMVTSALAMRCEYTQLPTCCAICANFLRTCVHQWAPR